MNGNRLCILCVCFYLLTTNFAFSQKPEKHLHDVVIYGGTSAGIIAAVQAKKDGLDVILVAPEKHLGGLSSGGLGWTDTGNKKVIGGLSRNFYQRVKAKYDQPSSWKYEKAESFKRFHPDEDSFWIFEPHIAEEVFEDLVREFKLDVVRQERIDLKNGVKKEKNKITHIITESGKTYWGKMFIDATYEGDLMAKADVTYTVGRESNDTYHETLNGVQTKNAKSHQFTLPVDPYVVKGDPRSGLLPRIHNGSPGNENQADHRVQAYCFRMCLTNVEENRIEFPKPLNYDPMQYELLARYLEQGADYIFGKFDMIPNSKTDTNNHGGFSFDNIGMNYAYPDGDYATREKIIQEHRDYQQGLLWFLANDPRVPEKTKSRMQKWGLPKDEFKDNGNWPHQIYVREARRMISNLVINENHLKMKIPTPDSVGMGSYNMDSHNVQRYVDEKGYARNEGDVQVNPGGPYPISYQGIVPKEQECSNLIVPVCVSSSHIAYGSIRMEPVFMILGESAATAANIALKQNISVQRVKYDELKTQLLKQGQVLEYDGPRNDKAAKGILPKELSGIVIDNSQATLTGEWSSSKSSHGFIGEDYLHDNNALKGSLKAEFSYKVDLPGRHLLYLFFTPNANRATNVPVTVQTSAGTTIVKIDQKNSVEMKPSASALGEYKLKQGETIKVTISNEGTNGHVIADGLWVVPVLE